VTVKTSRSAKLLAKAAANEKPRTGFRFWRRRVCREEEAVNKFGFLGNMADTLDLYYVPDASSSNKFTLEKVCLVEVWDGNSFATMHLFVFAKSAYEIQVFSDKNVIFVTKFPLFFISPIS